MKREDTDNDRYWELKDDAAHHEEEIKIMASGQEHCDECDALFDLEDLTTTESGERLCVDCAVELGDDDDDDEVEEESDEPDDPLGL